MPFSEEVLADFENQRRAVQPKYEALMLAFVMREFTSQRAGEYARNGFARRLGTLARCIENVFRILPPDRTDLPSKDELTDAAINLQAFVLSVYGSIDNLAWVWVEETRLTQEDGTPLPKTWIGLGRENKVVRSSFSQEFQDHLAGTEKWFEYQVDFRHALAHRIPLYIPPHVVPSDNEAEYLDLEARKQDALRQSDLAEHDKLHDEQNGLVWFHPVMTHSFDEGAGQALFHGQLLSDFLTVEELGKRLLVELDQRNG